MSEQLFKIIGLLLIASAVCVLIKVYRPDFALAVSITCVIAVLLILFDSVFPAIDNVKNLLSTVRPAAAYFGVALKALGISYLTGFAADVCRDFGQSALAAKAEFAGKCAIFILSMPLINSILDAVTEFAGL